MDTEYKNLKYTQFKFWNIQLSQKEVGKYPIASNPYLELWECQKVWIQIRPDILSGLIWIQTICKGYQQMAKVTASKERIKGKISQNGWKFEISKILNIRNSNPKVCSICL